MTRPFMTDADRADVFRGLAHPLRRKVLALISRRERTVTDIQMDLAVTEPTLSRHLLILRESGLVRQRKVGRRRYYYLNRTALRRARSWLEKNT